MPIPTLVLRNVKGSALTFTEMDNNLQNLANISISNDTSPTLGGNLNVNGNWIKAGTSNVIVSGFNSNAQPYGLTGTSMAPYAFSFVSMDIDSQLNTAAAVGMKIFNGNTSASPQGTEITFKTGGTYESATYQGGVGVTGPNSDFSSYGLTNLKPGDAFIYAIGGNIALFDFTGSKKFSFSTPSADIFSVTASTGNVTVTGDINLAAGKGVYINGVALGGSTYSNVQVATYIAGTTTQGSITLTGNITGNTAGFSIGYRDMPQVSAGNVTLALTDAGKHYYDTITAPTTVTIPNNANVAFATGTVISFVNHSTGNLIIGRQDAVSLFLGGNATSAGRTITSYGVATVMKVATNTWFINGSGVV